jgi:DNA-binding XRE family transcriptional regulator
MVQNRIKVLRAEAGISATALAEKMPDGVDKVAMSFIEGGRVSYPRRT